MELNRSASPRVRAVSREPAPEADVLLVCAGWKADLSLGRQRQTRSPEKVC